MIRVVSADQLKGYTGPGIHVRDHFRGTPENIGSPHYMLGPLRVLADTTIEPDSGFPEHPHAEMEIVSYVSSGILAHADTLGGAGRLAPGDVQVMTTGKGLRHSEVNGGGEPVRMYQMWFLPNRRGLSPGYADVPDPGQGRRGVLQVLVSGDPERPGAGKIHADAVVLGAALNAGQSVTHEIRAGHRTYVLAAAGNVAVDGVAMAPRGGAEIDGQASVTIAARDTADVLVLDLS